MEEKKNKRTFLDNELRKHRISSSMKRKWHNMRRERINETFGSSDDDEFNNAEQDSLDMLEQDYMKVSDDIANSFLTICDRLIMRADIANHIKSIYLDDDKENNSHKKRITITPEQRKRLFDADDDIEGDTDNERD